MKMLRILMVLVVVPFLLSSCTKDLGLPITKVELSKKILNKDEFILLDVRSPEEYARGHIEGSINIKHTDIESNLGKLSKDKDIIVYCHSGSRAKKAIARLKAKGYKKVHHLKGDWLKWNQK